MADGSKIEWTDATWNPVTGCSVVSPGCTNCYAMKLAGGRLRGHPSRKGLTIPSKAGPVWTGEVRLNEEWLDQPLRWSKPRNIFVCAHGDLFHENVPDEWIDSVFAVMALCRRHHFQVLTKRPIRMHDYQKSRSRSVDFWESKACELDYTLKFEFEGRVFVTRGFLLTNVWVGISAEDQKRADERIPPLLETPAAVRFVSAEPLLGPITFHCEWLDTDFRELDQPDARLDRIIVGGESGSVARPMHPEWARGLRDQCQAAGVPFFLRAPLKMPFSRTVGLESG